ncbi:hypothetical protein [Pseudofrankia inefficax]|uniref:Uncharacterized protein n=1 Tax=Pseudofrankia inefficax (strain DSM 45817 / CECT 9037 / DDB 130130 / EuI1c) TaxID=298654 RepID=E3IXG6_PSEI1|nr:hypothetical protein [Pseudofrankia inefficax]ADP78983.1 hypothetical protein FraEuI1c_0909 [Pseudofrankia inefficax]
MRGVASPPESAPWEWRTACDRCKRSFRAELVDLTTEYAEGFQAIRYGSYYRVDGYIDYVFTCPNCAKEHSVFSDRGLTYRRGCPRLRDEQRRQVRKTRTPEEMNTNRSTASAPYIR